MEAQRRCPQLPPEIWNIILSHKTSIEHEALFSTRARMRREYASVMRHLNALIAAAVRLYDLVGAYGGSTGQVWWHYSLRMFRCELEMHDFHEIDPASSHAQYVKAKIATKDIERVVRESMEKAITVDGRKTVGVERIGQTLYAVKTEFQAMGTEYRRFLSDLQKWKPIAHWPIVVTVDDLFES
jgi:hypothetical protein